MWSIERAWGLRASDRPIGSVFARHVRLSCPRRALDPQGHLSRTEPMSERNATWLILPVVICLSQRLSHACYNLNPLTRIHWRASLVPAAAVIPAPIAYI
ncbi:unnamed protein product [Prunus brigantina]